MSSPASHPEIVVRGIAASPGIARGRVFVFQQSDFDVPTYVVEENKRAAEMERFDRAVLRTRSQIQSIQKKVGENLGPEEARIFDAHLLVLEDHALTSETFRAFEETGRNIESCFNEVSQRYIQAFSEIDDEYLRERSGDIRDVAQRLLSNLLGLEAQSLSELVDQRVVVANNVSPSDAASIDRSRASAIVTDRGSRTSHAVIVARSMKIPAVVGAKDLSERVSSGADAIVDGYEGIVIINPTEETLFRYGKIQRRKEKLEQRMLDSVRKPATTLDGVTLPLRANIESAEECGLVHSHAADGVGLFRTEFLYLASSRLPTEEEQFEAYRKVAESMSPQPVTIRSVDLGGDKPMAGAPSLFGPEDNPFLGFRAIRFCLKHPDIFKVQLRAILRASAFGRVRLMYPMISGVEEFEAAQCVLAEARAELVAERIPFAADMKVGSMIEVPSAAIMADQLAKRCDFLSIGTNDLIQYLMAADRGNDRIAHLYQPAHPAVLRMIKNVVFEAHRVGVPVSVCGEMAAEPMFVPLLAGLGINELSMTPPLLPAVKYLVRAMRMEDANALAQRAMKMESAEEISELCRNFCAERVGSE